MLRDSRTPGYPAVSATLTDADPGPGQEPRHNLTNPPQENSSQIRLFNYIQVVTFNVI